MTDEQLLQKFGKMLDARFEAERDHTKQIIREEVAVEGKRISREQALTANSHEVTLNRIEGRVKDIEISNTRLEQGQAQTNTALEALAAGQKELQATVATKADVLSVGIKIDKMKKRLDTLEEGAGITHKN